MFAVPGAVHPGLALGDEFAVVQARADAILVLDVAEQAAELVADGAVLVEEQGHPLPGESLLAELGGTGPPATQRPEGLDALPLLFALVALVLGRLGGVDAQHADVLGAAVVERHGNGVAVGHLGHVHLVPLAGLQPDPVAVGEVRRRQVGEPVRDRLEVLAGVAGRVDDLVVVEPEADAECLGDGVEVGRLVEVTEVGLVEQKEGAAAVDERPQRLGLARRERLRGRGDHEGVRGREVRRQGGRRLYVVAVVLGVRLEHAVGREVVELAVALVEQHPSAADVFVQRVQQELLVAVLVVALRDERTTEPQHVAVDGDHRDPAVVTDRVAVAVAVRVRRRLPRPHRNEGVVVQLRAVRVE